MDNMRQSKTNNQKDVRKSGCCGTKPGIQILDSFSIPQPPAKPCCAASSEGTEGSGKGTTGTPSSSVARKLAYYWLWGFAGLIGITVLILGAGILLGPKAAVFWRLYVRVKELPAEGRAIETEPGLSIL